MLRTENDATNLPQIRGTGEEHLRYFIENRLNYCDSKWYAGDYPEDNAVVRIYTPVDTNGVPLTNLTIPANANITVTPYSNMYAGVRYKANGTLMQERLEANETYTFVAPNETFNDTETAIYGASQLSSLGDLAPLYLGYIDVGAATKLVELKIGDGTEGYKNANLYHLAVGTNRLLKKIDIQNCDSPRFVQALVLSGCPNIEEVYAKGSSITGVELPDSGYLKILQLPATITNLTLKNQPYIEDLTIEGYENLKTITIENCPVVNSLDILDKAVNVERVRLTNVDWHYDDASILYELIDRDIAGIDENGVNTDTMWVDGKCNIETLTGSEYAEIKSLYPYLEITYTTLISQLTYMSEDGTEELHRETIYNGGDGTNPVTNGTIETPTKESTAQYDFTFGGWSLKPNSDPNPDALKNVEADRIVYVAFNKAIISYTVNFYNVSKLEETQIVEYGSDATYSLGTPVHPTLPDYMEFTGWNPPSTNIQGDTNCYAQYYDIREITDDWDTIAAACNDGTATSKYAIGAYKNVDITYEDGTTETIPFEVIGHNHDELADGIMKWEYLPQTSVSFADARMTIWNNTIYALANKQLFKFDGTNFVTVSGSTTPDVYGYQYGNICAYNNELHIVGGANTKSTAHYAWNGTEWYEVSTLPVEMNLPALGVFNGELYALILYNLYKWDGTEWTYISVSNLNSGSNMFNINDKLYMNIGSNTSLYEFDGTDFVKCDMILPFNGCQPYSINDKLYAFQKSGTVYEYLNNEWVIVDKMPNNYKQGFVCNNEMHIFGSSDIAKRFDHYKWSGASLKQSDITTSFGGNKPMIGVIVWKNELYVFRDTYLYKWNGASWETITTVTFNVNHRKCILYNNEIHMISGTSHYKWDGTEETLVSTLPITYTAYCNLVVYNNEIHLFEVSSHYKWNGTEWILVGNTPFQCSTSGEHKKSAIVHNDKIYVLGGGTGYDCTKCYSWNGEEWSEISNLGVGSSTVAVAVYEGVMYAFAPKGDKSGYYKWDETKWVKIGTDKNMNGKFSADPVAFVYRGKLYVYTAEYDTSVKPLTNIVRIAVYENPKATLTFLAKNLLKDTMAMNSSKKTYDDVSGYAAGGWSISDVRTYLNGDFIATLPSDLQTALTPVNKLSGIHDGNYNKLFAVTKDSIWIPSTTEVVGELGMDKDIDGQGEVYSVFTDSASYKRTSVDGTIFKYFLRSQVLDSGMSKFWLIYDTWAEISGWGNNYNGILIGFCL